MSQPPDVISTGTRDEKRHPERYVGNKRALLLERILVGLVFLFLLFVFALLVYNSIISIDTANQYLPTVAAPTK